MKASELLKNIEEYLKYQEKLDKRNMVRDHARIRISCEFNKLKVFYTLTYIDHVDLSNDRKVLELSNRADDLIPLNCMCDELRENGDADLAFIVYDDEGNRIIGFGENDKFFTSLQNHIPSTLRIELEMQ